MKNMKKKRIKRSIELHEAQIAELRGAVATLTAMIEELRQPGDGMRAAVRAVAERYDDETPLPCPTCKIIPATDEAPRVWCDNPNCGEATVIYGKTPAAAIRRWNAAARVAQSTWGAP
jgi:hypothetical protein